MSPTARSLKWLRDNGYYADVVERWIMGANIRKDLFGFIDIVAIKPGESGCLGIQTTSQAHVKDHIDKVTGTDTYRIWLECGNKIQVHGWAKKGPKGKRKTWTISVTDIS